MYLIVCGFQNHVLFKHNQSSVCFLYVTSFNSLLAIRITLDSISYFAVILYDVKRLIQKISPHSVSLRSTGTVSPETNSVPFPSPLTTRRDYGGSILTRLHTGVYMLLKVNKQSNASRIRVLESAN
jgi:hypothetical protein